MTDGRTKQAQEIHALLAERRKYEEWLAQLEARKATTPDHVFLRVQGDYAARLADAQKKLSAESGALRALAAELEKTLAAQERQIAGRADERAEAEVRAAVGEFAGKEWDKLRAKLDSAIADLSGERDATQRELDTLHALLADAESADAESDDAESAETESADADTPNGDVDDIAFLRSVLGTSTPYVASTPAAGAPDRPVIEPPTVPRAVPRVSAPVEKRRSVPVAAPADEAEVKPEPAPARSPRPQPAAASSESRAPAATTARAPAAPREEAAPEAFAAPEVPEEPSGPRGSDDRKSARLSGTFGRDTPRTSEAVKSLKCQECGTLNHPTEWYCERCGGELAAF